MQNKLIKKLNKQSKDKMHKLKIEQSANGFKMLIDDFELKNVTSYTLESSADKVTELTVKINALEDIAIET